MWNNRREHNFPLWGGMGGLQNELNRLFESYGVNAGVPNAFPPVNTWEENDAVYAEAELPGTELADLEISVTGGNQLTIKGERRPPIVTKGAWHRQERGFGSFTRVVSLPVAVDSDKVEARFSYGVLTVRLPKSEQARPEDRRPKLTFWCSRPKQSQSRPASY